MFDSQKFTKFIFILICFSGFKESSNSEDCFSHTQEEYATPEKIKGRCALM
jgi:hypothetical protein